MGFKTVDAVGHSLWRRTMNARGVPLEARKERSGVCFGGFRLPARSRFGEGRPHEACGGAMGFSPWSSTLRLSSGEKSLGNGSPEFLFFIGIMFIDKKANPPFKAEGVFIFHLFIA